MKLLALDTETTTHNKGHPYDSRNRLVCYSAATDKHSWAALWDEQAQIDVREAIREAQLIVGFNFKFDAHWLIKHGITEILTKQLWDVQIAEFILSNQTHKFPSLNDTCAKYGLETKEDIVKTQYWDKGIQTDEIPWEILSSYAAKDSALTLQCYYEQIKRMSPAQIKLCYLQCQDLYILQEMEAHGIPFDEQLCEERAKGVNDQISETKKKLASIYPNVPVNFASNDHLSAFLYGGTIKEDGKEHIGFYKTGAKAGQPKYKNIEIEHTLPRLFTPLKGSEMKKEGVFATDEGTLRKLKGKKSLIDLILGLSKLEKLNGTYYLGLVKLRNEMHWPSGLLHGNFNQTTAATGRLSSSKPNLQNFSSELLDIFISEYND